MRRTALLLPLAAFSLALCIVKVFLHNNGMEWITSVGLLTALMGGVFFTLVILLSGTLADYKESERLVVELASQYRSMRWDMDFVFQEPTRQREAVGLLQTSLAAVTMNLKRGRKWDAAAMERAQAGLERVVMEAAKHGAFTAQVRTLQVWLANLVRIQDRLESIMTTSFLQAGYALSGVSVALTIVGFTFADMGPIEQAVFLYGFGVFLLAGLFVLIWDLDNPFSGFARVDLAPLERLATVEQPAAVVKAEIIAAP